MISNDYNRLPNRLIVIVPLTGTNRGLRIHLPLAPPEGGITKPSVMMCDQMRAVSLLRFRRHRGEVTAETLHQARAMVGRCIDREIPSL